MEFGEPLSPSKYVNLLSFFQNVHLNWSLYFFVGLLITFPLLYPLSNKSLTYQVHANPIVLQIHVTLAYFYSTPTPLSFRPCSVYDSFSFTHTKKIWFCFYYSDFFTILLLINIGTKQIYNVLFLT